MKYRDEPLRIALPGILGLLDSKCKEQIPQNVFRVTFLIQTNVDGDLDEKNLSDSFEKNAVWESRSTEAPILAF